MFLDLKAPFEVGRVGLEELRPAGDDGIAFVHEYRLDRPRDSG